MIASRLLLTLCAVFLATVPTRAADEVELTTSGKIILRDTNAERKKADAKPVRIEAKLTRCAQEFAEYLAREDKFAHDADGRQPWDRAEAAGYPWAYCSENIAMQGAPTDIDKTTLGEKFVKMWMESPGHKKNLLDVGVTEIGIGVARKGEKVYAVQVFGVPKGADWKFRVTNEAGVDVKYRYGDRDYTLKPRETIIHPSVRPTEWVFTPPTEGAEPIKRAVREATTLTIRRDGEKYRVE